MPLSAESPIWLHIAQNVALFSLAAFFTPLITFLTVASQLVAAYLTSTKRIGARRKWLQQQSSSPAAAFQQRTILVTGVGMSKGLHIARAFYRAGHNVIGADFEPYYVPVCGRFSVSLSKFYRLRKPETGAVGSRLYVQDLLEVVRKEKVDLWVSCSGVASAVSDGEAKEAIEKSTSCKAIQFGVNVTEMLHEKDSFIANTKRLGLNVPETILVVSIQTAMSVLHPEKTSDIVPGRKYIMKSVGMDDSVRADMTLLPLATRAQTEKFLTKRNPSASRPFVLQQYISGPEYCTHSICINGEVKAFTACPSAELLMHYRTLSTSSPLFKAMKTYTEKYAAAMGKEMTGHFSMDFMLEGDAGDANNPQTEAAYMDMIYPIECNPRAHTAVVLFTDKAEEMAEAYLTILTPPSARLPGTTTQQVVMPNSSTPGYYWIGHDLTTRVITPALAVLSFRGTLRNMLGRWLEFAEHVLFWRDGTYEIWDPWPFWWLYVVYWPGVFATSILYRQWWSRCNVSTTKTFKCV